MSEEKSMTCCRNDVCALAGSAAFFAGIPGSDILINGPLWCYFYAVRHLEKGGSYDMERFLCTQIDKNALVYGTEDYLKEAFETIRKRCSPERLLIQNSCSVSLIGDDLKGIAKEADFPFPVYTMDSGGLNGGFAGGYTKAAGFVLSGLAPSERKRPRTVNLLGCTDFHLKGREDTIEMRRLLALAGYEVIAAPGGGSCWEDIERSTAASLNIVVREELGLKTAEMMKEKFGIPFIVSGMPYGIDGTGRWIERIREALPVPDDGSIGREAEGHRRRMNKAAGEMRAVWGPLWFDRILISAPPSEALGLAEAVRGEWADTETLTVICSEAVSSVPLPSAADEILFGGRKEAQTEELYAQWDKGLLMASSCETARLIRKRKEFSQCPVARPVYDELFLTDQPFCGFRGAEYMLQRLWQVKTMEKERQNRK